MDLISLLLQNGLEHVVDDIFSYFNGRSLKVAEAVCMEWRQLIAQRMLWMKLIERNVRTNSLWHRLANHRGWIQFLFTTTRHYKHSLYRDFYDDIINDIQNINSNWRNGRHVMHTIDCGSEHLIGVRCLQYDDSKIVCGLENGSIKIWDWNNLQCLKTLTGHTQAVWCLQYDDKVIISGSSDRMVIVWDVNTGEIVNRLTYHTDTVLQLRFNNAKLVTSSKNESNISIAVWNMISPTNITFCCTLPHNSIVQALDLDEKYIVTGGNDNTIKVWSTVSGILIRNLTGHMRRILCLQYHNHLVISGSLDHNIRIWDIERGVCLRTLSSMARSISFDLKRIVCGGYDGVINIFDLTTVLNPNLIPSKVCLRDAAHSGFVNSVQFDELKIISGSSGDKIFIWDFSLFIVKDAQ